MQRKTCKSTKSVTGCGKSKPEIEFKIIRINKNTGVAYRKRLCRKCENESYRVKKKPDPAEEKDIFNQLDQLMRGQNVN